MLCSSLPVVASQILHEKSADAVHARAVSLSPSLSREHHVDPLWPIYVPTQSPVSPFRSIGSASRLVMFCDGSKVLGDKAHRTWMVARMNGG